MTYQELNRSLLIAIEKSSQKEDAQKIYDALQSLCSIQSTPRTQGEIVAAVMRLALERGMMRGEAVSG